MQFEIIKKGDRYINRFNGSKVTVSACNDFTVDYIKDTALEIIQITAAGPQTLMYEKEFTKPKEVFIKSFKKLNQHEQH